MCAALCGVRAQAASPRGAGPQAQRSRLARSCRRRRRRSRSRSRTRTRSGHGARPERDAARSGATRAVFYIYQEIIPVNIVLIVLISFWSGMG